ncbi:MAG: hypothetical protein IJY26_00310, partial [Clostridia bacterium]|nr:hypothetical protein [Clostridia bacterium]
ARNYDTRSYAKNSATSLFYVSFKKSNSINKNYCVFGELYNESAQEEYDALMSAIQDYISANISGDDSFTETTEDMDVDKGDWYYKDYNLTATYNVPVSPIVIKSVKVNRY